MSDRSERKRKRQQTERKVITAAILILVISALGIGGGYVFAKYYAQSYQKGIAIASGIYFTSNYAVEVAADEEDYFESIIDKIPSGTGYSFVFEVRNYENNLLFNESTVVIPYTVSFWLEEAPAGATYTVTYNRDSDTETMELTENQMQKATFSGHSIAGGKAMANKYTIDVTVAEGVEHTLIPVYAEVKTESGAVINMVLRGKMVLSESVTTENYIESQQFVTSDDDATDEEKFKEIQNKAGMTYEIRTVGEVATGGVTEELKLAWDPEIFEVDLFDDAYIAWKNRTSNDEPLTEIRNNKTWYYITLEVMPYSSQSVNFFRGEKFTDADININSLDKLYEYIEAELFETNHEVIGE